MRRVVAKWSLWAQLCLAVAALVVAGVAMVSGANVRASGPGGRVVVLGGVMVSGLLLVCGVLLVVGGVLGLVALRKRGPYLRAGIVLFAPLALGVGSSLSGSDEDVVQASVLSGTQAGVLVADTLRLLDWASWLTLGSVLLAAVAGLTLVLLGRQPVDA